MTASTGAVVGENLRRLRQERGWTQDRAAKRIAERGMPWGRSHIADLETGRRETIGVAELVVLAHTFGVRTAEFFAGDGDVRTTSTGATSSRALVRSLLSA